LKILLRGALLCEEKLEDKKQAWSWYKQAFDALRHLDETIPAIEEAAHRMELWAELIDAYGVMTKTAEEIAEQVEWWLKIAEIFSGKMDDPAQALEAILRGFGLDPDNEELLDKVDELSVKAENWARLATVYNVLAGRASDKEAKIDLLKRYAEVLFEKGGQASKAFDVSLKAFELDPTSDVLLVRG